MSKHIGSRFDEFLEDQDLLAETEAVAIKRVLAWQIESLMPEGCPANPCGGGESA